MVIHGLNKLSLLDYPNRTACTVFTGGCNFRCPFCHNASLVLAPDTQPVIPEAEVLDFLKKRQSVLEGVCITGGEPTLQPDIGEFIEKIKNLGYKVKLDTNGYKPDVLKRLVERKLVDCVAMDIKNSLKNYYKSVGIKNFDTQPVENSAAFLLENKIDYEFRTTVVAELNDEESFSDISKWLRGAKKYFLQSFVDSGDLIKNTLHAAEIDKMRKFRDILQKTMVKVEIRGI